MDIQIKFWNNIKYVQKYDNWYINNCEININDKSNFIKTLEKWSNWSFWTDDMKYAKCEFKSSSSNDISTKDINELELIKDNFYKWKNKWYILFSWNWVKFNWKEIQKTLCEIVWSNWEWLNYIWKYIIDSKNIYEDKSFINTSEYKYNCDIKKLELNETIDIKTLQSLKWWYYKDRNWIYYFYDSSMSKPWTLKVLKLESVDIDSFDIIDDFYKKAQDKNFIYTRWEKKERVKFIKKDNIKLSDFQIYNEELSLWNRFQWKIYSFIYKFDIKTNIKGNFMWKINLWWGESISDIFEEWKSLFYKKFDRKDNTEILIEIYDKNWTKESIFDEWKLIWTFKRSIKYTEDMEKPIFINKHINNKKQLFKNYLISKSTISKNSDFKKYIPKLNNLISNINIEKLKEIDSKLEKFDLNNKKFKKYKIVLEYLKAKIKLEIYERENN